METNPESEGPRRRMPSGRRGWLPTAAVAVGLAVGAAGLAGAATGGSGSSPTATDSSSATAPAPAAPNGTAPDPSTVSHGPGETLLTGDTAARVEAAARKAVPGATVIRVETDSGGATYEAHLTGSDGSTVTVRFDKDLNVTATGDGFGPGPQGQAPPGRPGTGSGDSSSASA